MPFTASHVAAVIPFARRPMNTPALVIGSMVPDLPLFTSAAVDYPTTHSLAGAVTYDALLGAALLGLWHAVLKGPLLAALPLQHRGASKAAGRRRQLRMALRSVPMAYLSLVVGALTHLTWDEFTHSGGWGVEHVGWLAATHATVPGHEYAQHASTLLGAGVLCWWVRRWLRESDIDVRDLRLRRGPRNACFAVTVAAAASVLVVGARAGAIPRPFVVATTAIPAGFTCALMLALGWHAARIWRARMAAGIAAGGGLPSD